MPEHRLQKTREAYREDPQAVMIHKHAYGEPCGVECYWTRVPPVRIDIEPPIVSR